jgi:hypothetical protein
MWILGNEDVITMTIIILVSVAIVSLKDMGWYKGSRDDSKRRKQGDRK